MFNILQINNNKIINNNKYHRPITNKYHKTNKYYKRKKVNNMYEAVDLYEGTVLEYFEGSLFEANRYFAKVLLRGTYFVRSALVLA